MTKETKKLVWRLKEQPSTESLRELVKDGILTNQEAREILFSEETQTDRDVKSLETEIKFLRELIDRLATPPKTVEIIREVKSPYWRYEWYKPYEVWCSGSLTTSGGTTMTYLNAGLSDIKTF